MFEPPPYMSSILKSEVVMKPLKILVAEDNEVNQKVLRFMLAKYGHTFEFANDGLEAIRKLGEGKFDLVLMDCQMPNLDGLEATQKIRANETAHQLERTPIVALTANAMVGDREKCLAAGMDDFLAKPFKIEDIKQKLLTWTKPRGIQ